MQPENLTAWVPVIRDVVIVLLAAFILCYETILIAQPNIYLVGAALTLLGVPAATRLKMGGKEDAEDDG